MGFKGTNPISKRQTAFQAKKAWQEKQDAELLRALQKVKTHARSHPAPRTKRLPTDALRVYILPSAYSGPALRDPKTFRSRSYDQGRQVLALIDHLFVRYPVPLFLYRSMLSFAGLHLVFDQDGDRTNRSHVPGESKYRHWFLAVAQGQSFAKAAKDSFTKREAHWFLLAPPHNTIAKNIFWARAAAAGVPRDGCDYLADRIGGATQAMQIGDRMPDLLRFYAEAWAEMRGHDRDEITDFVRTAIVNPSFSFKGRTFGSVRKLCHEWHRTVYAGNVKVYRSWTPTLPLWEERTTHRVVRALELTSNRALADEGQKQRHCVYTYTEQCLSGRTCIVSLRWYAVASRAEVASHELERITVEVSPSTRRVVQIRGRLNRRATEEEMKGIRHWAGVHGLRIDDYA